MPAECWAEETDMPVEMDMVILYTSRILTTSLESMKMIYAALGWPTSCTLDFGLGHGFMHDYPMTKYYWESVRDRVRELTTKDWMH